MAAPKNSDVLTLGAFGAAIVSACIFYDVGKCDVKQRRSDDAPEDSRRWLFFGRRFAGRNGVFPVLRGFPHYKFATSSLFAV